MVGDKVVKREEYKLKEIDLDEIFTTDFLTDITRANTNATAILIGERVADFIKQG